MFVVKDGRPAPFLYQHSVSTDLAYNNYPNDGVTGKSLYSFNSFGANTISGNTSAVKVSFDRPMADAGLGGFINWGINLVRWLERSGYDVTYSTISTRTPMVARCGTTRRFSPLPTMSTGRRRCTTPRRRLETPA